MAKKQTRRSISVSRTTYERLKAFCETNHISMSQLVETRVNDFLGPDAVAVRPEPSVGAAPAMTSAPRPAPMAPRAPLPVAAAANRLPVAPAASRPEPRPATVAVPASSSAAPIAPTPAQPPMTSAAARFAVDPPPPIIKPRQETAAPKPAEKRPDQIFTF